MATDYFSVDRRGFYKVGAALDLFKENPLQRSFISTEGLNTPGGLSQPLKKTFPKRAIAAWLGLHDAGSGLGKNEERHHIRLHLGALV